MIIKAAKRIFNSDKICRSYSDLNFGVSFLEHSVYVRKATKKCFQDYRSKNENKPSIKWQAQTLTRCSTRELNAKIYFDKTSESLQIFTMHESSHALQSMSGAYLSAPEKQSRYQTVRPSVSRPVVVDFAAGRTACDR